MAEYIDREKALTDLKESAKHHANNSREEQLMLRDRNILREQATADVVKRSKVNKAIEEINDAPVLFVDFPLGKHQVLRKDVVLDILKRNIGE